MTIYANNGAVIDLMNKVTALEQEVKLWKKVVKGFTSYGCSHIKCKHRDMCGSPECLELHLQAARDSHE